jgi:hypothetical protein
MNYNINLPEELKTVSKPKFKIDNNTLAIYNRPFWDDWLFEVSILLYILYMTLIQKLALNNQYVLFFLIILFIYSFYCFSLNKVNIEFAKKEILIRSYNPFINIYRRFFQIPFLIKFNDIDKVFSDWKLVGKGPNKYFVVLQTEAPYKFRIAIFMNETQSKVFTEYLNHILK